MAAPKFIVFGPTGKIGSVAALTAHNLGAPVVLAMRDTNKAIPDLDSTDNIERVQADLTDPDSVRAAVEKTGAKYAFVYVAFAGPLGMRPTIEALKGGGIEFVIFISTFYVSGNDPHDSATSAGDIITTIHAAVEVSLHEVFGPGKYVALRPGYFASNLVRYAAGIRAGRLPLETPDAKWDFIAPEDIGLVAGNLGARGPAAIKSEVDEGRSHIVLLGPQLIPLREGPQTVARVLGQPEIVLEEFEDDDAAVKYMVANYGMSEGLARGLITPQDVYQGEDLVAGPENIKKFGGRPGIKLEDWVAANKEAFA